MYKFQQHRELIQRINFGNTEYRTREAGLEAKTLPLCYATSINENFDVKSSNPGKFVPTWELGALAIFSNVLIIWGP